MSASRHLTVLDDRRAALETCGYCPKLCRSACPVSEAEGRESLIPWGKMSMTWYVARGDLTPDRDVAELPWACTGCLACREMCEHKNPVAPTLLAARAVFRASGLAPAGSEAAHRRFETRHDTLRARARELGAESLDSERALLIGCGYLAARPGEARDVVRAGAALGVTRVLSGCCGQSFRAAGDAERAERERAALLAEAGGRGIVVADAGCAEELRGPAVTTLIELAVRRPGRLSRIAEPAGPVRYHDPCRLARGLGVIDEPRLILERAFGTPPAEFERRGRDGACSGAGGLLPFTRSQTARSIARERLAEHRRLGGGTLVTACAASGGWFRAQGENAIDLASVIARSLSGG
jgi:Fe-S oxidoreductase